MIPLRLSLRNFLCYREEVPPLSFESFHIACLSGENGSGKSALLDAITWALWGEARGRSQEELVHHGQTEMGVEFDFAAAGNRYRVVRRYGRGQGRRPEQRFCSLQVFHNGSLRPIAEGVRECEARIRQLLRMDYHTFVNTAFLRQGRADEFTLKKPAEKREILAEILGLSLYGRLEERARARARERKEAVARLSAEIETIDQEISHRPRYQGQLEQVEATLRGLEGKGALLETRREALRRSLVELEAKQARLTEAESAIAEEKEETEKWQSRAAQHQLQIEECQMVLSRRQPIEESYQRLEQARAEDEALSQKLLSLTPLNERRSQLTAAIENARRLLEREGEILGQQIAGLQQKGESLPRLRETLTQLQSAMAALKAKEARLEESRHRLLELSASVAQLRAQVEGLKQEVEDIKEKRQMLSVERARCPLCLTELGEGEIHRLRSSYQQMEAEKTASRNSALEQAVREQKELLAGQQQVAAQEKQLREESGQLQRRLQLVEREMAEAEAALKEAKERGQQQQELKQRLLSQDFAREERGQLRQTETEIAALSYDELAHRQARQRREEFKGFETEKQRLEEALRALPRLGEEREQALAAAARAQRRKEALEKERLGLVAEVAELPTKQQELTEVEASYAALRREQDEAQQQRGGLLGLLRRCQEREAEKTQKEGRLRQVGKEESIYHRLGEAFGKRGVPALIVEAALRELEEEADYLLKRLSEGRMSLRFETQRETRGGETVEALEVKISDDRGTRSYEMYSGGEAFRINFALRVALSKLLARRAGSPLRLLVVDEGFGTQDAPGREKLVEAINAITPDFDKIIAITHLEELKELFPVKIEVTKTPQGSTIALSM